MQRVDFFKLTREKQERFIASTRGAAPPAPIAVRPGSGSSARVFAIITVVALVAIAVLFRVGFGSLSSALAVHRPPLLGAYVVLVFLVPFCALRSIAAVREAKTLPFKPGIYAFPMCVIDARRKRLGIVPMERLTKADPAGPNGTFVLTFKGAGSFSFPVADAETGRQLSQQLEIAQANVKHATASQDDSELVTLDPLYDAKKGWSSPIGPKQALKEWAPGWKRFDALIALGLALTLGPLFWFSRNAASEDAMLKRAGAAGTSEAYRQYLAVGSRHKDDVSRILLPRAELKEAVAVRTVEAMQGFVSTHPGSAIDAEAQAALHDAYARELETAKQPHTVTALRAFAKRYPANGMDADVAKAVHALYVAALARFTARAATADPAVVPWVQRLLTYLESHGPTVRVGIVRGLSPGLDRADKVIGQSPVNLTLGPKQVTRRFNGTPPPASADAIATALGGTFDDVFPADILSFASTPSADEEAIAALRDPSIAIRYRVGWLGNAFSSTTYKRAFAAITLSGEAVASIPGDAAPLHIKIEVSSPKGLITDYASPTHSTLKSPVTLDPDSPEPAVYAALELRGIDIAVVAIEQAFFLPAQR